LHASPNIIGVVKTRRMRRVGHVAWMGGMRNAYNILVGKPVGNRIVTRPRCRWETIRMDRREIGW